MGWRTRETTISWDVNIELSANPDKAMSTELHLQ